MRKILISACLLGEPVRYDGASMPLNHPVIHEWNKQGRLVAFCPETAGGLLTPRPPAEIKGGCGKDVFYGSARVATRDTDVTTHFIAGARAILALAKEEQISLALLKEKSPSCGSTFIYDGSFTGTLIPGMGVATALLQHHGISVFGENDIDALVKCIK